MWVMVDHASFMHDTMDLYFERVNEEPPLLNRNGFDPSSINPPGQQDGCRDEWINAPAPKIMELTSHWHINSEFHARQDAAFRYLQDDYLAERCPDCGDTRRRHRRCKVIHHNGHPSRIVDVPGCGPVEVDEKLVGLVVELNKVGIRTVSCCQGDWGKWPRGILVDASNIRVRKVNNGQWLDIDWHPEHVKGGMPYG